MARRNPIITVLDGAQIASGLMPDKHPVLSTLWAAAANVRFFAGKVRRRVPQAYAFNGTAHPVRGLSQHQRNDGVRWLWTATGGDVYRWYAPAPELILGAQPWQEDQTLVALPTFWDFTHFGDWTIINSGKGAAKIFKDPGVTTFGAGGDNSVPTDVLVFLKMLNFIIAVGHGPRGNTVSWSNGDDIEIWNPATAPVEDNLSGDLVFDDLSTPIRAACRLGQMIAVYGEEQLGLLNYIGGALLFGQKVALQGIGCVGKAAVCSDGRINYGVSRAGVWMTDSSSFKYIDEGALSDYLQDNVNWAQAGKINCVRNDYTGCIEFFFPMAASLVCNEGWSFDPQSGGWSKLPGQSLKNERLLFNYVIAGDDGGNVRFEDFDPTAVGALTLRTRPMLAQVKDPTGVLDAHTDAKVDEIILLAKKASNVQFRLGASQTSDGAPQYTEWVNLTTSADTYKLSGLPSGVWWTLDFQSTAANWDLDLQGFQLFGQPDGTKRGVA